MKEVDIVQMKKIKKSYKAKSDRKKKWKEYRRKVLVLLIGYPFVFPYEKLKKWLKEKKEHYWLSNLEELREKSLKEMVLYIEKDMIRYKGYCLYNAGEIDDISYGNAFYLQDFVGYGGYRYREENKSSKLYEKLIKLNNRDTWNADSFYNELFQELHNRIQSRYEDLTFTLDEGGYYTKKFPYYRIDLKGHSEE